VAETYEIHEEEFDPFDPWGEPAGECCECCGGLVTIDADGSWHYWHTPNCRTFGQPRVNEAEA